MIAYRLPESLAPLADVQRWVVWRYESVRGRQTKVPYCTTTRKASSTNPGTWRTFAKLSNGFDGPGIVLGDGLQGVDLDVCIDAAGQLEPWADAVVQRIASYTEVSPSGRGLKIIFNGPDGKSAEVSFGAAVELTAGVEKRRELAYYTGGRYFTVTGKVYGAALPLRTITESDAQWLREQIEHHRAQRKPSPASPAAASRRDTALPRDLERLIVDGPGEGADRSAAFHHAVRWAADCGLSADRITGLIEGQPGGVGAKYHGRVAAEVARSLRGYVPNGGPKQASAAIRSRSQAAPALDLGPLVLSNVQGVRRVGKTFQGGADFADPVAAANSIVESLYTDAGLRVLHYWQGEFHWWARSHYVVLPMADVREMLYRTGPVVSAKPLKKRTVDDVLDALKAATNLSHRIVPAAPAWVDRQATDPDPRAVIPVRNGLVNVDTGELLPTTPRLFVPYALPFDFSPNAAAPVSWLEFLASVWGDDTESVEALQEWLGYLLTADTSQQKALLIVGPRRSGKGTIGRVVVQLLGERNVASPTLASLGNNFGLEPLIGKTAALMSDARLGGRADIAGVAENLLRLTGEDTISVDRKFREAYTARLLARIVVLTNEVPVFRDAASALPSRFIVLRTDRSFYGREDHSLDRRLAAELPGILVWALAGLRRLRERGRFIQPAAGAAQLRLMEDLASPISAFLREDCIVEPGAQVPVAKLYERWRDWCREHGRDQPGTEQTFGRDIAAAVPGIGHSRPRINGERVRMYDGMRLRTPDDPEDYDDDA